MEQDKQDLISYIEKLRLDHKIKTFLIQHVKESIMDEALLNRVASVLELIGEELTIVGEVLEKEVETLDEHRSLLDTLDTKDKEESEKILQEFLDKVRLTLDTAKTERSNSEKIPVLDNNPPSSPINK